MYFHFLNTNSIKINALPTFEVKTKKQHALQLQRVLMGMMLYLGGGLRKQIFVNLYTYNLVWDNEELVMQVGPEKVARLNTNTLPLPS